MPPALYRLILVVLILVFAALFLARIPNTVTIVLVAALTAFGAEPAVERLERRMPRVAAVALIFFVLTVVIVLGLFLAVPPTIEQVQSFNSNLPSYAGAVQHWLSTVQAQVQNRVPGLHLKSGTFDLGKTGGERVQGLAGGAVAALGAFVVNAATSFFIGFSALVLAILFLLNSTNIAAWFASCFPQRKQEIAKNLSAEIATMFGAFIAGQVTVSGITAVAVAIVAAIIGFKLPWILLVITFVGYSIPIFGMVSAQLIAVVLSAPQGLWMVVWVQAIMFFTARISDNVLVPKIMGRSVGISPIGVMLATFAGGELFGFIGLLLGVPLAALVKILWTQFGADWIRAQFD